MFTTYYRDVETEGNDYAQARYNVSGIARFSSPDPVGGSTSDPQSLNRYSYVRNMPAMLTDPFGTCPPVVQNHDPDDSQDAKSGGPSAADSSEGPGADPEPPQHGAGACASSPWYYNSVDGGAWGGWAGGGAGGIDGGYNGDDSGFGVGSSFGVSPGDPFSIITAAFTPTSWYCGYGVDCHGSPPNGMGWTPVYGNLGLLSLLGGPQDSSSGSGGGGSKSQIFSICSRNNSKACANAQAKAASLKQQLHALNPGKLLKTNLKELGAGALLGCGGAAFMETFGSGGLGAPFALGACGVGGIGGAMTAEGVFVLSNASDLWDVESTGVQLMIAESQAAQACQP